MIICTPKQIDIYSVNTPVYIAMHVDFYTFIFEFPAISHDSLQCLQAAGGGWVLQSTLKNETS